MDNFLADYFGETVRCSATHVMCASNNSLKIQNCPNYLWKDWGSGTDVMSGDAFTRIMQVDKCDFKTAVETAKKYDLSPIKKYDYGSFWVFREDGEKGKRIWNQGIVRGSLLPLYKINEAIKFDTVYIVEGEKCVDSLWQIGIPATCSALGAQNALKSDWSPLKNKKTIIIPDCDEAGQKYYSDVKKILPQSDVITLQGKNGYDIADYLADDKPFNDLKTKDDFEQLIFPIGFCDDKIMLYDKRTKQYYLIRGVDISKQLIILNPNDYYWACHFLDSIGKKGEVDKNYISRQLIMQCQSTGRNIQSVEIRECGIYHDKNRVIANYGNNIFVNGEEVQFNEITSEYFYKSCGKSFLEAKYSDVDFENTLKKLTFATPLDIKFFMGTIFSGYLSGAISWRTHIWITGETGSGKSQIKDLILVPAITPIHGISRDGTLTEASIRQLIKNKATIFVHDEAETSAYFEKEMNLIRESSSGGQISRGTSSQEAITFSCQNTYILLSISTSIQKESDEQRIIKVFLRSSEESSKNWTETKTVIKKEFDVEYYTGIMLRAARLVVNFKESFLVIKKNFVDKIKTKNNSEIIMRCADTYSTPLAGYWHWTHDEVIDDFSAAILVDEISCDGRLSGGQEEGDEINSTKDRVWEDFLSYQIKVFSKPRTIAQLIIDNKDESNEVLESYGIKVKGKDLFMQYKNRYLISIFRELGYMDYASVLKRKLGVNYNQQCWIMGKTKKGLLIPIDFDINERT